MATARIEAGIFHRRYALTTLGSWSLIFLAAFESLAVTTVMPVVTADLGGRAWYSVAFAATMAAGVVGMVVAGVWADRRGPARPLLVAIVVFAAGLAVAGTAHSMGVFVAARFGQGLGAGGITVALNVLVGRVYPAALHPMIFGAFASAWVVPSLIGPFLAGLVADAWSWHWVFLGVLVLVVVATLPVLPTLRRHDDPAPAARFGRADARRIAAAVVVALGVVVLSAAAGWRGPLIGVLVPVAGLVIGLLARPLLPVGTYRARPGLPATVLLCALAGAAFFGTEVYLPLLLHDRYGLPSWLSGATLTTGALGWAVASAFQGRAGARLAHRTALRIGALLLAAGVLAELTVAGLGLPALLAAVSWWVAGMGMGTVYPRISTLVLAYSGPGEQGFNTSAKTIADAVGGSVSVALVGLLFAGLAGAGGVVPFVGVFLLTTAIAGLAVIVSLSGVAG